MKLKSSVFIFAFLAITFFSIQRGLNENLDDRSRASDSSTITVPTVVSAPKTVLTPPYIRLISPNKSFQVGDQITIDMYATTNGLPIVESLLSVSFDPSILSISEKSITPSSLFPVISLERNTQDHIVFSLFVPTDGFEPIVLTKEEKIGSFTITVLSNAVKETRILVNKEQSGLLTSRDGQTGEPKNIILSTEGATISLK